MALTIRRPDAPAALRGTRPEPTVGQSSFR